VTCDKVFLTQARSGIPRLRDTAPAPEGAVRSVMDAASTEPCRYGALGSMHQLPLPCWRLGSATGRSLARTPLGQGSARHAESSVFDQLQDGTRRLGVAFVLAT
jgi:hypothetical protein